ncbi:tyrosine-type recombinase/integrase [Megamonas hypermegale]|uniref:site-specific integrase n=1 Tax=Megamonas hypermegale TaxID=158847 RepID=UPI0026EF753D|nr:tyrosine-type recombinase/integrase [Megamonas hypermegale]
MARIYKQNNKWCFSISKTKNGKRRRIVRGGFLRERDAKKAAREFENNLENGTAVIRLNNITLHDFMYDVWFVYHKNFVKISTQVILTGAIRRIDRYFSDKIKLKDITAAMCMDFVNHLFYDKKLSRSTITTTLSCLKMIFKHAFIVEKIIAGNPTEYVFLPKMYSQDRERILSSDSQKRLYLEKNEIHAFLSAARQAKNAFPFVTFFMLLIYTGMRAGEALALEWKNVDLKNKVIHVKSTIYYKPDNQFYVYLPKTKSSIRDIVISDTLLNELKQYRKKFLVYKMKNQMQWTNNGYDFVFVSRTQPGNPIRMSTVSSCTKRLGDKIGFTSLHPHMFRHTHVSILAAAQVPLTAIKERLGHSNDKTTEQIYLHITKQFKAEAADKFDAAMQGF